MAEARQPPFGHESPGVDTRRVVGIVVTLGTVVAIALVALWLALTYWVMPEHAQLKTRIGMLPPAPRLQPHPDDDLTALREEKRALLEGYAWTEKSHDFARIPIQRAMQIYVQEHKHRPGLGTRDSGLGGDASALKSVPGTADRGRDSGVSGNREKPQVGVIPAKAGIHFDFHNNKLDPGFRRDDEQKAGNSRSLSAGDHHPVPAAPGGQR